MYQWGDKLIYRNEFECLFVSYCNEETKESALVLLKGNSNVSISHISDLSKAK